MYETRTNCIREEIFQVHFNLLNHWLVNLHNSEIIPVRKKKMYKIVVILQI